MITRQLIDKHKIISDQIKKPSLEVVLSQLEDTLTRKVDGDIVELGCYVGTTSLFIQRLLENFDMPKAFHVYDSFQGLPRKHDKDQSRAGEQFKAGELSVNKAKLIREFKKAHLELPIIHKQWFADISDRDIPATLAFGFLDGDFYESIYKSLQLVWPRLSRGGIICIDDYKREALPGVECAVMDFFGRDKIDDIQVSHNIAIIKK